MEQKYLVTSGSHWTVRLGHSSAWVITRSYRKGVFFFQILYSSLMTLSSTASSYTIEEQRDIGYMYVLELIVPIVYFTYWKFTKHIQQVHAVPVWYCWPVGSSTGVQLKCLAQVLLNRTAFFLIFYFYIFSVSPHKLQRVDLLKSQVKAACPLHYTISISILCDRRRTS